MGNGAVQRRVEWVAFASHFGHAELFERREHLLLRHLDALAQVFDGAVFLLERAFKVICNAEELLHGVRRGVAVKRLFFTRRALAEVVILRSRAQQSVFLLCKLLPRFPSSFFFVSSSSFCECFRLPVRFCRLLLRLPASRLLAACFFGRFRGLLLFLALFFS